MSAASSPPDVSYTVPDLAPFGNFPTYYKFNPVDERLSRVPASFDAALCQEFSNSDASVPRAFTMLDIGCNSGDLTIALANRLQNAFNEAKSNVQVCMLGVDIDPSLITRANERIAATNQSEATDTKADNATKPRAAAIRFVCADLMAPDAKNILGVNQLDLFTQAGLCPSASAETIQPSKRVCVATSDVAQSQTSPSPPAASAESESVSKSVPSHPLAQGSDSPVHFDLVTMFSVTMWIHLHHGDEGLQRFLREVSAMARHIVVEPQPWKCYKTCKRRWHRNKPPKEMPRPLATLSWGLNVDQEIVQFLQTKLACTFKERFGETNWERQLVWFRPAESQPIL